MSPTAPQRVLYVSHSAELGSERTLLRLVGSLDRRLVEPIVALPDTGPLGDELRRLAVPTLTASLAWWIPATHWSAPEFRAQLEGFERRCDTMTELVRSVQPDIVHTNALVTLEGAVAAARLGLPHVLHCRGLFGQGFPPPYFDDVPFLYGVLDSLTDVMICVSQAVERQASSHCRAARCETVYDGFDPASLLAQPREPKDALLARLQLPPGRRLAVCLGGLQRRKGQRDLILALDLLKHELPELVVVLAGAEADLEYVAELQELLRERGLEERVCFAGFQTGVRSLLENADMLVHPSYSEGFAFSVLEAATLGTPVVATRSGGPEEILEEETTGLFVEPGDPAALAAAMGRLLTDPELSCRLRRKGLRRAARFTLESAARGVESIYRSLPDSPMLSWGERRSAARTACVEVLDRAGTGARRVPVDSAYGSALR